MKLYIVLAFCLVYLVAVCSSRPAEEEYAQYDEEPAPPPKKVPARNPLVGRRNPLSGRNTKTTTTTAPPALEEEEEPVAGEEEIEEQPEQISSTTEAPKKFIKSGIVRPFRSNDDLLATLKRRREQVAHNKQAAKANHNAETDEPAPVQNEPASKPAKSSAGRRRFNNPKANNNEPAPAEETAAPAAPARTGRRFSARS